MHLVKLEESSALTFIFFLWGSGRQKPDLFSLYHVQDFQAKSHNT